MLGGADRAGDLIDRDHRRRRRSGPASTATSGTSACVCSSASPASLCGAITRMPSTPWRRSRSTASVTDGAVERLQAGDDDEVAGLVGGLLDPEQRRRRAVQRGVEADHAERLRAAGDERARHRVRPVAELLHRREHSLARLGPDVRAAVDDPRDRLVRDAGKPPDVRHHRRARPAGGEIVMSSPGSIETLVRRPARSPLGSPYRRGDVSANERSANKIAAHASTSKER